MPPNTLGFIRPGQQKNKNNGNKRESVRLKLPPSGKKRISRKSWGIKKSGVYFSKPEQEERGISYTS
jgi:hypothetical protein